jgi:hypothetical protein
MASQIAGKALLLANYGAPVIKASTLPASGTTAIFNVLGGNVLITSLIGVITTVVQAQATTLKLNVSNTASTGNTDISNATADLNAAAVGKLISLAAAGLGANTLLLDNYAVQNNEFVLGAGAIRVVLGATSTGAWKWYLNYIPLDPGAYVVAA